MNNPKMYPSDKNRNANPIVLKERRYSQTITASSVAANVVEHKAFTVTGVASGDVVVGFQAAATGNASGVLGAVVTADDEITISFVNSTAGALTPGAGTYEFLVRTYA